MRLVGSEAIFHRVDFKLRRLQVSFDANSTIIDLPECDTGGPLPVQGADDALQLARPFPRPVQLLQVQVQQAESEKVFTIFFIYRLTDEEGFVLVYQFDQVVEEALCPFAFTSRFSFYSSIASRCLLTICNLAAG